MVDECVPDLYHRGVCWSSQVNSVERRNWKTCQIHRHRRRQGSLPCPVMVEFHLGFVIVVGVVVVLK